MKLHIGLLGTFLCLGTLLLGQTSSQTKSTQAANRIKKPSVASSVIGCVDQQNGQYVMRNEQTSQVVTLQSPNADNDSWFARFVGHKVEATGANTSGATMRVSQIHQVSDMCGTGK